MTILSFVLGFLAVVLVAAVIWLILLGKGMSR